MCLTLLSCAYLFYLSIFISSMLWSLMLKLKGTYFFQVSPLRLVKIQLLGYCFAPCFQQLRGVTSIVCISFSLLFAIIAFLARANFYSPLKLFDFALLSWSFSSDEYSSYPELDDTRVCYGKLCFLDSFSSETRSLQAYLSSNCCKVDVVCGC